MAKSHVLVRPLQAQDKAAWGRLWASYLDFYGATLLPEATERTWRRILDPAAPVLGRAAALGSAAVGFAICIVHEGTWSIRPTCYLEDLFVDAAARGGGIGRALLDDLVALGRREGWASIYWHTKTDNAPARRLYDRYVQADGFVRYRLALPPEVTDKVRTGTFEPDHGDLL